MAFSAAKTWVECTIQVSFMGRNNMNILKLHVFSYYKSVPLCTSWCAWLLQVCDLVQVQEFEIMHEGLCILQAPWEFGKLHHFLPILQAVVIQVEKVQSL